MQKIQFKNPVFLNGQNVTCRKGIKWGMFQGSELEVVETGHEEHVWGYAKIKDIKIMPFESITDNMITNEHDPSCRDISGLFQAMVDVYPRFISKELVTLIYFDYEKKE